MGWVVALFAITALVMLGFIVSRPEVKRQRSLGRPDRQNPGLVTARADADVP